LLHALVGGNNKYVLNLLGNPHKDIDKEYGNAIILRLILRMYSVRM
jgi:hypothetical protein